MSSPRPLPEDILTERLNELEAEIVRLNQLVLKLIGTVRVPSKEGNKWRWAGLAIAAFSGLAIVSPASLETKLGTYRSEGINLTDAAAAVGAIASAISIYRGTKADEEHPGE